MPIRFFAFLFGFLWFSPGALAADTGELRINGHINAAMAQSLQEALNHGPRTIRITSTGGDQLPSLALARDIRNARATLIVDGLCGGPCANYLFPAAVKRTVMPGALVIFSGTATSALTMVPRDKTDLLNADYVLASTQEKALIAEAGMSPVLLLEPQRQLRTSCYSLTSKDAAGKSYVNYRADFIGWMPSRIYLARAGLRVEGFWPANPAQFQATLQSAFPAGARGAIASFGPSSPDSEASLREALGAVRPCDASGH